MNTMRDKFEKRQRERDAEGHELRRARTQEMISMYSNQVAQRQARYSTMTDEEILAEYQKYEKDLDDLTRGHGDVAYMKANSLRLAWTELIRRGQDPKAATVLVQNQPEVTQ